LSSATDPLITPHSGKLDPVELGPVRVVGWQRALGEKRPMLHSKMLVLGVTTDYADDEMFAGDILTFHPKVTWMGSANWSANSRRHVEFGLWSSDAALVQHNLDYLLSLLTFSEPRGVATVGPVRGVATPWDQTWCEIASARVNWRGQNPLAAELLTPGEARC
jgi:hypothetical protein